ncbi:tetratricopeptide repeat protein [Paenibacillus sp. P25]|nr:tetratricopeptide repeat protein [Paenibacillus sp. P25]
MQKKKRVSPPANKKVIPMHMDATFFFEKAVQSLDRYHYDKALKYFRRAAEYEPENPVNHCNLAGLLSEMGNYEESNRILQHVLDQIDPSMTECYFYMANNFANMENYESAEQAIIHYLENDPTGQFLEESEEMMELLSYELDRPTKLTTIKSREGLFEHDRARSLLEEGRFNEAVRMLERIIKKHPDFMAARNNLALAYYYMGHFDKSVDMIRQVLELEPGNLHALCNLAIFYQHFGDRASLAESLEVLRKTYPFHQDHVFKLATTMGILGEHEKAFLLFKRLLKTGEAGLDPCLFHYTAVAAYNTKRYEEAERQWKQAEKFDPGSDIPKFYLNLLKKSRHEAVKPPVSYHYHLPFEEQFKGMERSGEGVPDNLKRDPLVRSSFFWAPRHGDTDTKLQVIQAFGLIGDDEVKDALLEFVLLAGGRRLLEESRSLRASQHRCKGTDCGRNRRADLHGNGFARLAEPSGMEPPLAGRDGDGAASYGPPVRHGPAVRFADTLGRIFIASVSERAEDHQGGRLGGGAGVFDSQNAPSSDHLPGGGGAV